MLQFTQAARIFHSNRCFLANLSSILVANTSAAFAAMTHSFSSCRSCCLFSRTSSKSICREQQRHSSAARVCLFCLTSDFSIKSSQPAHLAAMLSLCIKCNLCLQPLQALLSHLYLMRLWTMASSVGDGGNVKLTWGKAPSACDSLSGDIIPHHEHKLSNMSCGSTARCTFRRVSET
jgi:hypothetical protein